MYSIKLEVIEKFDGMKKYVIGSGTKEDMEKWLRDHDFRIPTKWAGFWINKNPGVLRLEDKNISFLSITAYTIFIHPVHAIEEVGITN